MPLDTAGVTDDLSLLLGTAGAERRPSRTTADTYSPGLDAAPTLGAALRAAREFHGLDLEDLAQATRIRRGYLTALEDMRLEDLPSRPFIVGYVRSYAKALGLDPDAAVARFRMDAPEEDQSLRAPVGVRKERDPRLTLFIVAGLVVVIGIALWNVAQHSISPATAQCKRPPNRSPNPPAKSAALPPPSGAPGHPSSMRPCPRRRNRPRLSPM